MWFFDTIYGAVFIDFFFQDKEKQKVDLLFQ